MSERWVAPGVVPGAIFCIILIILTMETTKVCIECEVPTKEAIAELLERAKDDAEFVRQLTEDGFCSADQAAHIMNLKEPYLSYLVVFPDAEFELGIRRGGEDVEDIREDAGTEGFVPLVSWSMAVEDLLVSKFGHSWSSKVSAGDWDRVCTVEEVFQFIADRFRRNDTGRCDTYNWNRIAREWLSMRCELKGFE